MDFTFYKLLHMIGLVSLFLGIGGMISYSKGTSPFKGLIGAFHGIGLVLILVGGFGISAKLHYGFPTWMIIKLVIWVALAAMIPLAKREVLKGAALWSVVLILGTLAAYLGIMKPFQG